MKNLIIRTVIPLCLIISFSMPVSANGVTEEDITDNAGANSALQDTNDNTVQDLTDTGEITENNIATENRLADLPEGHRYITVDGRIGEANEDRILVENELTGDVYYNITGDTLIYGLNSFERLDANNLQQGQRVSVFYNAFTPQALSFPPQVNPEVIIIHNNETAAFVKVDFFDEATLSSSGLLRLDRNEVMLIVDTENRIIPFDTIRDRNLIVFYTSTTDNITQATPVKVVLLNSEVVNPYQSPSNQDQLEEAEAPNEDEEANGLENGITSAEELIAALSHFDIFEEHGLRHVALYRIADLLGYTLEWNPETALITMWKDNSSFTFTNGNVEYGYNKSMRHFGTAPFIINSRTYVEEDFLGILFH